MKYIEIDEELYGYIASKTEKIGESASDIIRRLLALPAVEAVEVQQPAVTLSQPSLEAVDASAAVPSTPEYQPNSLPDVDEATTTDYQFSDAQLNEQKGAVGRFLFALYSLYQQAPTKFDAVLQVQGRDRLYFACSKDALLEASKSSNPKEIGDSGYWVTTNNNTGKKQAILTEVVKALGCSETAAMALVAKALP
ncbi:replication initiation negative regulator SeqA [Shewanella avicenniae]|uniref:Negative modulator of initiation of replication n=1 Tax=Shewanella avicenniae TaxID=2814294 RepID=A0ABX7QUQ6_9GAMM|nr:replication initiation negative regulator SeqA [Shewanella avicenniae]QSX35236.1 replication initiation negative regulator SeqA [Shewanella avicenniae]